jgi:DNA-binding PadR family transcriptional regulator
MAHVRDLRGSRRDLALVFAEGQKTAHEAAKAMGRPTGSIYGVVRRMHADGLLVADSDPDPPTRGTQYRLSPEASDVLRDSLGERAGVGQLLRGQRLLIVERKQDRVRAASVLATSASAGIIAWGAELSSGWLIVIDADVDPFRIQRLCMAFERAGCRCREGPVDAVLAGSLLRERATTLTSP